MDPIRFALANPVTVAVGVILVVLFGFVALGQLPYQLSPRVEKPVVTVATFWPGASPYEIERDIVEQQENVLKGLSNLDEMESTSADNAGFVTLSFDLGITVDEALLRVSNKLDEVPSYPENVDKPILTATGAEQSGIIYLALQTLDPDEDIYHYLTFFEDNIKQYLERVPGVAEIQVRGGTEREMHVILDPQRLSNYSLTINEVISALRGENVNISAGSMPVGRRDYRVRTVSEYRSPEDIAAVIIRSDGRRIVRVSDIATVRFGYSRRSSIGLQDGVPGIVLPVVAEPEANTLDVTRDMEAAVAWLNEGLLADNGLQIRWLNDQRQYIEGAIALLQQNILVGGVFAFFVLLLFLRSFAATVIVATTIPISVIGAFIFMRILGTTLNIVSLAGIAFAVGMLVDNAIVVLENIDRHRHMGKTPLQSAYDGAREVWGAVLASSLTTIAVFLPVIFLELEAGMLFRDIAIAVTFAVMLSLVVSITVIPVMSRLLFENRLVHKLESRAKGHHESRVARIGRGLNAAFMAVIGLAMRNVFTRLATILILVGGAFFTARTLMPSMEYLPEGNRDLIFNVLIAPPGLSYAERNEIGQFIATWLKPYYEPGATTPDGNVSPGIKRIFFMSNGDFMGCGMVSLDPQRARELIPIAQEMMQQIPGVFGISNQSSIFGRGIGQGRNIDVNLSGPRIETLVATAQEMMGRVQQTIPNVQIRPNPSLDVLYPETRFIPDAERLQAVGLSAQEFGVAIDVLMDGRDIGDFKQEGEKKIDLVLKMSEQDIRSPEDLAAASIPTPTGRPVPVSALATRYDTTGLTAIRHFERNRTFSLSVTPPLDIPLQDAMETITDEIIAGMRAEGRLDGMDITLSGTADSLTETRVALQWNLLLAVAITYLLMSALFGNFLYPLVILFTVPLAGAGGFIGLQLVNLFITQQRLDVLTMLGFIILIGVVVNNAILIVHQSLNNIRFGGMEHRPAVLAAVQSRLRPIYMTAATSIFGMLPLVVWPGPGSELYRGLGSVVLGGLALSTIFTVFLIPSLLLFVIGMEKVGSGDKRADNVPDAIAAK